MAKKRALKKGKKLSSSKSLRPMKATSALRGLKNTRSWKY